MIPPCRPKPITKRATELYLFTCRASCLYSQTRGYFNRDTPVVGHMERPINYWKVYCREEWNIVVNKQYKDLAVSFLTPVELFTPWYGFILARHMLEHRKHNLGQEGQPLVIYEIGGGNGTLARDILVSVQGMRQCGGIETSWCVCAQGPLVWGDSPALVCV